MNVRFEKKKISQGFRYVVGCDEVGRGSLAGPVVAAAVVLDMQKLRPGLGIKDSKQLPAAKRSELSESIKACAVAWAIGEAGPKRVDEINIHNATLLAMKIAVEKIFQSVPSETCLLCVDGKFILPNMQARQQAVVGGDRKIISIAAASILAKVYRDGLMEKFENKYPGYGFAKHKGYGTLHHRRAISKIGLSPIHRRTFCSRFA